METMYYIGLDVHKKNDQLLREGQQRPYPCRRRDSHNTIRSGHLDEETAAAVDGCDGSDYLHGLDLRSPASARGRLKARL
jgi:hypothetical protein